MLSELPLPILLFLFAVVGLCVGSFLNVVIVRLPRILEQQSWQAHPHDASHHIPLDDAPIDPARSATHTAHAVYTAHADHPITPAPLSLSHPPSHCPHCHHVLRWYENIPILSFLWLRGRCAICQTTISWRYPLIELTTGIIFFYSAWHWSSLPTALAYATWATVLLGAAVIDWNTTYLPDDLTIPLIWGGLIATAFGWLPSLDLHQSLAGACAGYLSLWLIYWAFKLTTGREGLGYGDFKLLAAIGAWLGWQALIPVVLISASLGSMIGFILQKRQQDHTINGVAGYIPFGPFLAFGAICQLLTGWQI